MNIQDFIDHDISIKSYKGLMLFNYSQCETPKSSKFGKVSRGHIRTATGEYVCRPPDRFFNLGENGTEIDPDAELEVFEKVDGSLIKLYFCEGWHVGTRGTFFAESQTPFGDFTYKEVVEQAVGPIAEFAKGLDRNLTYIFELTSPFNRVVINYGEQPELWLLTARNNKTGEYLRSPELDQIAKNLKVRRPARYTFSTVEEIVESANALPYNDEGYVLYADGIPSAKVKSGAYVAVHLLRNQFSFPALCELVWKFETTELVTYFPDYSGILAELEQCRDAILRDVRIAFDQWKDLEQKEFALKVKNFATADILFKMKRDPSLEPLEIILAGTPGYRERLLRKYQEFLESNQFKS